MAVTFVIGRAGSGKTRRTLRRIVEAARAEPLGPPIFWLQPKQATFTAERQLTGALGAFTRVRVVSFDLLGRTIAGECGGSAVPEVTEVGRQMILGHLLRRHQTQLGFFASAARRPGLAAELDATFAEFERSGKTPADLTDLLDQLRHADPADAQGPSLQAKLRDLLLLYDAYTRYLGQERLDPHRRLQQVREKLEQCTLLRDAAVYVDNFPDFTDYERRVLVGLGKTCRSVEITLLIDPASPTVRDPHHLPDELSLFHRTESTYRKLWFAMGEEQVKVTEPVLLTEPRRFVVPEIRHVERSLFTPPAPTFDAAPTGLNAGLGDPVRFVEAPDPRIEVDAVAREVGGLLQEGFRLRDVAVLVRDLGPYHGLIDTTFREHGIPYFVDRRRTAAHHPLLQFVRSIFQIARGGWPHPAVMTFLKSGLAGVTLLEADEIENYLLQHRLRGRAWDDPAEWRFQRRLGHEDDDAPPPELFETRSIDLLRRQIVDRLRPLLDKVRGNAPVTVRDVATEVFNTFERFGVRQTLARWMEDAAAAGDLELRGEHEQVWAELSDLFEQMVDLLGDEQLTPADFVDVLESGLERFDLALTPPTVDQVLVGQVDRTRAPPVRAAFVLGLNEGSFPHVVRDATILSHTERRELRRRQLDLDPDPQRRQLDERLLAYVAFTLPSERLVVTRPLSDDSGTPAEPSEYWQELLRLLPGAPVSWITREAGSDVRQIATPRQLVTCLMKWAAGVAPTDARASLYQWFTGYARTDDAIAATRTKAWRALAYRNEPALSPEVARLLFPPPLHATAAQLETHAACPFRHFLKYGMRLRGREAHDLTALDMSHVFHEVLEIVVAELLEAKQDWKDLTPQAADEMVRTYAQAVAERLKGEVMLGSARGRYVLDRIERTLGQVIATVREMLARGTFRPAHAGVRFGESGPLPPYRVKTPGGAEVALNGQMDRVDVVADGADAGAVAVFDYKLGGNALSLGSVYHGLSLQLLTYLLVLESAGEQLAGRPVTPAAAFYVQLLRGLQAVDHPDLATKPTDALFHLRHKPRGVFHARFIQALDSTLGAGAGSDVVQAHLKKDGQFGYRDRSDVADAHEFSNLLGFVRGRIGQIADDVMAGRIDAAPYRIGRTTPCPRCEFRPVCRFEPAVNGYRHLAPLKRGDVLDRITGKSEGGGADAG